jgi:glycosyltransferase involved in cell wall biosynthesis
MSAELRIGVPAGLLALEPVGGHGKVWHRVLAELGERATIVALGRRRGFARGRSAPRLDVVLASGHDDLPRTDAPLVVQVHEAGWFEPGLRAVLNPEFLAHIASHTESAVRAAVRVITPARVPAADLVAAYGLDPTRVRAVPHGVDPGFTPSAPGGAELVAAAGGAPGAPYVLYAASLHPRKNLPVLRQAMAALAAEGLPHLLVVAGGPAPDRADSTALELAAAAELPGAPGRVVRVGTPSDAELAGLMAGAAAFCLPSLYEGFGLTVLEAMACGAAVVSSDRGALPEVVGGCGVVVAPEAGAVREGLRRVLTDRELAARLSAEAAVRARGFTWRHTAEGWLSVLGDAARAGRS